MFPVDRLENIADFASGCRSDGYVCADVRRYEAHEWRQSDDRFDSLFGNEPRHCSILGIARKSAVVHCEIPDISAERRGTAQRNRTAKRDFSVAAGLKFYECA